MTPPSPMWTHGRRVTLQGVLGLVVSQQRAALSGLSAFSRDPLGGAAGVFCCFIITEVHVAWRGAIIIHQA